MFCIAWQYLTGRCAASDFTDRDAPEWPPHPDRVYQALIAAWGERGEAREERSALEWLESLGHPILVHPHSVEQGDAVKVYVPINDASAPGELDKGVWKPFQPMQDLWLGRDRQKRAFPAVRVEDGICALVWPNADVDLYRPTLERLCAEVIRIGHSSSFVRCWISSEVPRGNTLHPVAGGAARVLSMRVPEAGRLEILTTHRRRILEGGCGDDLPPRARQVGYAPVSGGLASPRGEFKEPLLIFRELGNSRFGLRQAPAFVQALRGALIHAAAEFLPEALSIVSGHAPDGTPLRNQPHLAYLPLAFIGHEHADGHLMGVAIAFPGGSSPVEEQLVYELVGQVLDRGHGRIPLLMGSIGASAIEPEERLDPPRTLRSEAWCQASRTWASATPIVLDRMQNRRRSNPDGWAADLVADMCQQQALPRPVQVVIRPVSCLIGAPASFEMPPLRRKDGSSNRMVHAHITWSDAIAGPLLLGAGRFKGYGLCKPCAPWEGERA